MMTNRGFVSVVLPLTHSAVDAARTANDVGEALVARGAPGDAARGENFLNEAARMVESFRS